MKTCVKCGFGLTIGRLCKHCTNWDAYSEVYNEVKEDFMDDVEEEE